MIGTLKQRHVTLDNYVDIGLRYVKETTKRHLSCIEAVHGDFIIKKLLVFFLHGHKHTDVKIMSIILNLFHASLHLACIYKYAMGTVTWEQSMIYVLIQGLAKNLLA